MLYVAGSSIFVIFFMLVLLSRQLSKISKNLSNDFDTEGASRGKFESSLLELLKENGRESQLARLEITKLSESMNNMCEQSVFQLKASIEQLKENGQESQLARLEITKFSESMNNMCEQFVLQLKASIEQLKKVMSDNGEFQRQSHKDILDINQKHFELLTKRDKDEALSPQLIVAEILGELKTAGAGVDNFKGVLSQGLENVNQKLNDLLQTLTEGKEHYLTSISEAARGMVNSSKELEGASHLLHINQTEFQAGIEMLNSALGGIFDKLSEKRQLEEDEQGQLQRVEKLLSSFSQKANEILIENSLKTREILIKGLPKA